MTTLCKTFLVIDNRLIEETCLLGLSLVFFVSVFFCLSANLCVYGCGEGL